MGKLATAQGNGNSDPVNFDRVRNPQGQLTNTLYVGGTFGGASVTLEASPDAEGAPLNRWYSVPSVIAQTAQGSINFFVNAERIRIAVAGGTGEAIDAEYI